MIILLVNIQPLPEDLGGKTHLRPTLDISMRFSSGPNMKTFFKKITSGIEKLNGL